MIYFLELIFSSFLSENRPTIVRKCLLAKESDSRESHIVLIRFLDIQSKVKHTCLSSFKTMETTRPSVAASEVAIT
jgi:hypothetical protein